ncbi:MULTISPECIES: hypothetical protein [Nostocales]|uniref:hypothetical protein n=1 Tax=Nostocales TaxID=1161 RepID=UPI001F36D127|nr:hypothetical protein [Nostoc sp. CMAA1605]
MPTKLVQAAIITFLLYVIAGLNNSPKMQNRAVSPSTETPVQIISMLFRSWH